MIDMTDRRRREARNRKIDQAKGGRRRGVATRDQWMLITINSITKTE